METPTVSGDANNPAEDVSVAQTDQPPDKEIFHVAGWRICALWFLGAVIRIWCRTLRVEIADRDREIATESDQPMMFLIWHNRLFVVPWIKRRLRNMRPSCALVSASKDGAALAKFFNFVGLSAVRGSSSRLGREALRDLIAAQRAGNDMAVTPDGPRGPMYEMKPGALLAARRARCPIILLGVAYDNAWSLRSWDRFRIPKPFSTVRMRIEKHLPDDIPSGHDGIQFLRTHLLNVSGEPAG